MHGGYGDPNFIAPETGDFRVAENSPALGLGFKNFPMDQFGVENERLRKLASSPEIPKLYVESFQKEKRPIFDFLGAKVRKIKGLGDRSAAGLQDENGILVVELPTGTLAEKQGVLINDVIIKLNDKKTSDIAQLMDSYQGEMWKGRIDLTIIRNQEEIEISITL